MQRHNHIKSIIKETGLSFEEQEDFFISYWKINSNLTIKIILAHDIHPEWIHILCNIGQIDLYEPKVSRILLRLNNTTIGAKFSLSQSNSIVCIAEIPDANLLEDFLKKQITQVVKMVTSFYELVKKENLKLNST